MLLIVEYNINNKTKIKGYFSSQEEVTTWAKNLNLKPSNDYTTSLKNGYYNTYPKF